MKRNEMKVVAAEKLRESFSGHKISSVKQVSFDVPDVVIEVGSLVGVMYRAKRDGEWADYYHEFKKSSQPLLCASADGNTLVILGGRYKFTDHGIEDR